MASPRFPHVLVALLLFADLASGGDLPFLPKDGARWPEEPLPFSWLPAAEPAQDRSDDSTRLYPNLGELHGHRVLRAVRAAYGREVRIELTIDFAGERTRLDARLPEGSLLLEDARVERSWPARPVIRSQCANAEHVAWRIGNQVLASASRRHGDAWTLRLAIGATRLAGERRFEGDGPTLVLPEFEFASLVVDLPVRLGQRDELRATGGGGDLLIEYRVSGVKDPTVPHGVRVLPLFAALPLVSPGPVPGPGLAAGIPDRADEPDESVEVVLPKAWRAAAGEGVSLGLVKPNLVLAAGDATGLRDLDHAVAGWWRERGSDARLERRRESGERTVVPLTAGSRAVLLQGRLRPVAANVAANISQEVARSGVVPGRLFTGRSLVLWATPSGGVRVLEMRSANASVTGGENEHSKRDMDGPVILREPKDDANVEVVRDETTCESGKTLMRTVRGDRVTTTVRKIGSGR